MYLSIYLSIFSNLSYPIYLSIYLSFYLSIYLICPVYLIYPIYLIYLINLIYLIYQSINLSIYQSIHLSIHPSLYLSIYPSVHPSIHPSTRQPVRLAFVKHGKNCWRTPLWHDTSPPPKKTAAPKTILQSWNVLEKISKIFLRPPWSRSTEETQRGPGMESKGALVDLEVIVPRHLT